MDMATVIRNAKPGDRVHIPLNCEVRRIDSKSGRVLRYTASNEVVDRYKTIIKVDGWETKNWLASPAIFWSHNSSEPPIGQGVRLSKEMHTRADGRQEKRLAVDIDYIPREVYPFADMIFRMAERGDIRTVSVGFDVLEKREPNEDEIAEHRLTEKSGVVVLARNELYEISNVGVPGNPEALIDTLASSLPAARSFKPADVTEKWLNDQLEAIRRNLMGEKAEQIAQATKAWASERGAASYEDEETRLDQPMTERRFREILREVIGPTEKRMADCFRGLAKRSEMVNLSLALEDLNQKVAERAAAPVRQPEKKADADLYGKLLTDIKLNLKGD